MRTNFVPALITAALLSLNVLPAAAEVVKVDRRQLGQAIEETQGLLFVEMSASWCVNCHLVNRYLNEASARHRGQLAAVEVDAGKYASMFSRYDFDVVPTVLVFLDGQEVARHSGVPQPTWLDQTIARFRPSSTVAAAPASEPVSAPTALMTLAAVQQ